MSVAMSGHLGLKKETAYGVEVTPDVFGEISKENLNVDNGLFLPRMIGGERGNKRVLAGPLTGGGGLSYIITPEDLMGHTLMGTFGSLVTTDLGNGAYLHTFKVLDSTAIPSYTVQKDAEGGCFNFPGTVFGGFSLGVSPDELMTMDIDMLPQRVLEATPATPSYTAMDPFTPFQCAVEFNSVSYPNMENVNIDVTNSVELVRTLNNQRYPGKAVATKFDCSGSFSLEFDDMVMLRRMWGNALATAPSDSLSSNSLKLTFTMSSDDDATYGIIGTSAYKYMLEFEFHSIYLQGSLPNLDDPDKRIMLNVDFVTKHDSVADTMMTVRLRNSEATY